MTPLYGHDKAVAGWVGSHLGKPFAEPFTAIGIVDESGHLRGGFVFNCFTDHSVEMSLAGPAVISRHAWKAVAAYVFDQLKKSRLEINTPVGNRRVRKLAPRIGFKFEGTARKLYGQTDGYRYSITADDLPGFYKRWRIA